MSDSTTPKPASGGNNRLDDLLTTLQQGVVAVNTLAQTMKSIFPSS